MAATTAFFTVFVGENPTLDVTVTDAAGVAVDISSATEITWKLTTKEGEVALVSKSKTGTEISLPGGGTDGVFRVATDFVLTPGTYYQEGIVSLTNILHTTVGTIWVRDKIA